MISTPTFSTPRRANSEDSSNVTVTFYCLALESIIETMRRFWGECFKDTGASKRHSKPGSNLPSKRAKEIPPSLLAAFDKVLLLGEGGWANGNWLQNQHPALTDKARRKVDRKAIESTVVNGSGTGTTGTSEAQQNPVTTSIPTATRSRKKATISSSTTKAKRTHQSMNQDDDGRDTTLVDDTHNKKSKVRA